MKPILSSLSLLILLWSAQARAESALYKAEGKEGGTCLFSAPDGQTSIEMACTEAQARQLNRSYVYVSYHGRPGHWVLDEVTVSDLEKRQVQARYVSQGNPCEFYFFHEDWDRTMVCSPDQVSRLKALGDTPLEIVYFAQGEKNFYLGSIAPYESEFTRLATYREDDRPFLCGFYFPEEDESMLLTCDRGQREALENAPSEWFIVTYTDAGGYRLLDFERVQDSYEEDGYDDSYEIDDDEGASGCGD